MDARLVMFAAVVTQTGRREWSLVAPDGKVWRARTWESAVWAAERFWTVWMLEGRV